MLALLLVCIACFLILVWHSRLIGVSLGLPVAYLFSMLLQHLPGAYAHLVGGQFFFDSSSTQAGMRFTAIGTVSFVTGVVFAQRYIHPPICNNRTPWWSHNGSSRFSICCLIGGWFVVFLATLLGGIPSLGAAIDKAGSVWILGVLLGLLMAVSHKRFAHIGLWLAALSVYPLMVLINDGFLSFGSTSFFVALSALLVSLRSHLRAYLGLALFSLFCFLAFLSYFQNRDDIREAVWGGDALSQRLERSSKIITDIKWFSAQDVGQLSALDERMNQNFFAGLAAQKIESGDVEFLHGRSIWEGLQALVPRALWPGKPTFAGSSGLIREMTDFVVNENTSFGVGQVMEFYVNFGIPGVAVGFLVFGFLYGWLDKKAASALQAGEFGRVFIWFLPAMGMLAPLASIAEVVGNVAASLVAAVGWRWAWMSWAHRKPTAGAPRGPRSRTALSGANVPGEAPPAS